MENKLYIAHSSSRYTFLRWCRIQYLFSYFMAFPSILLFNLNVSLIIFVLLIVFLIQNAKSRLLRFNKLIQWLALSFGIGAILSVINIPLSSGPESLDRALAVLPNYLYWCLLIIILVTHRQLINLTVIYKAIFWGIITTMVYYLYFQTLLVGLPIFNRLTPNTFAFILICYSPVAVYYLKEQKGSYWATIFLIILVLILLNDGRRAGMVLVLIGGSIVLFGNRLRLQQLITLSITIPLFLFLLSTKPIKSFILTSSERIFVMIYETSNIQKEDRSYLTRVVQIKKGLAIFKAHPYTGIGLNNFAKYKTNYDKSFEGAKYVVHKHDIDQKSAHNSYIGLLAEGGLFLFVPFILLLCYNIVYVFTNFNLLSSTLPLYIGLICMSVHLYFISEIVNVFAWFLIGICSASIRMK